MQCNNKPSLSIDLRKLQDKVRNNIACRVEAYRELQWPAAGRSPLLRHGLESRATVNGPASESYQVCSCLYMRTVYVSQSLHTKSFGYRLSFHINYVVETAFLLR